MNYVAGVVGQQRGSIGSLWRRLGPEKAGFPFVVFDGTLVRTDRVAANRPFFSGKHHCHGMNLQVIADLAASSLRAGTTKLGGPRRGLSRSPAEDSNACLLVWPGCKPEAFIALVCPDHHDGEQSRPGDSYHLAYAMNPLS